ncbi:MAG: rod shape-determining protein MreC [Anaerolineae bacterium]|nr:rod shape-determining protein MreC [Anaerolineae bacterium]
MRESPTRSWLPLALSVFSLLLIVFSEAGFLSPFESVFHYLFDPLQRFLSTFVVSLGDLSSTVRDVRELQARVEELQRQVDALEAENIQLREIKAEVETLRAQLNFVDEFPILAYFGADVVDRGACTTYPCGEVVGGEPNPYLRYVTINVGARHGVKVGMPVVSGGPRLVGRIAEVSPRTAKVQLITDHASSVAAFLQNARVTGLVVGQPDGSLLMQYIPQDQQIDVGDVVLTSGLGGTLPRGLIIGQVAEVVQMDYASSQAALLRPALDFSRLEQVLVITAYAQAAPESEGQGLSLP